MKQNVSLLTKFERFQKLIQKALKKPTKRDEKLDGHQEDSSFLPLGPITRGILRWLLCKHFEVNCE